MPHSTGLGTPISSRPRPITTPKGVLMRELGEEIPAQPAPAVVHGQRGAVQVVRSDQADQPVAQILALQQREDGDDEDDAERRQRREDGDR